MLTTVLVVTMKLPPLAIPRVAPGINVGVYAAIAPPDTNDETKIDNGNKRVFNVLR
ncbi:hypothetical protein ACWCKR_002331 [Yersinia enterocolitica]